MAAEKGVTSEWLKRDCKARFFLTEFAGHNGQTEQVREGFREVATRCGPAEVVYSAAAAEQKLLPRR